MGGFKIGMLKSPLSLCTFPSLPPEPVMASKDNTREMIVQWKTLAY